MITFYFDTSAIVKRYHTETGSEVLDRIFELKEHGFVTSYWTILEFTVAFSVRTRRKELSRDAFNLVISRFLRDVLDKFIITSVNDELVASATPLAVKYPLPSADCLQLASTISLKGALDSAKDKLVLLCSDKDLCRAAKKEGIESINPEDKDASEKLNTIIS